MSQSTEKKSENKHDVDGKSRFAWNVTASWLGYIFVLIPGFIMPRMISEYQGTVALGVWDLMWTIVTYMKVSGIGIASSSSRYVAKYVAADNIHALRSTVSTVFFLQLIIGFFVLICTVLLAIYLPSLYGDRLGDFVEESELVLLFLGGSLVHFFIFDIFRGVITGCHRWDIHNLIISINHILTFIAMVTVLLYGGGLLELSIAYFSVSLFSEIILVFFSIRTLPVIRIGRKYFEGKRARELIKFGLKTTLIGIPNLIVIQSTNLLVVAYLGPAYLAILARPVALLKHLETIINKYAFILTPMAGSIQVKSDEGEVREFLTNTTFYSVAFTLPILVFLAIFGDRILYLWMGEGFDNWLLIALLAIGQFLPISQKSTQRILVGLNAHGKIAIINIAVTTVTYILLVLITVYYGWNIYAAALMIVIPKAISEGIILPVYTCKLLKLSVAEYIRRVFIKPLICCSIFLATMAALRYYAPETGYSSLILGTLVGGVVLMVLYWYFIASHEFKLKIAKYIPI